MKVLVIGDLMVDRYTYVRSTRLAPEAPIPVWDEVSSELRPGGAANVANNIVALDSEIEVSLAGTINNDQFRTSIGPRVNVDYIVGGQSMVKQRYVDVETGRIIFRHDNIDRFDSENMRFFRNLLSSWLFYSLDKFDAVVLSDYDKGTITPEVYEMVRRHPLVIVDSKRRDLRIFEGAKIIKLNENEYSAQVSSQLYPCFERFFDYCVITRGAKPTQLRQCDVVKSNDVRYVVHTEEFPVPPVKPVDVTGCGDTHVAAMVVSLLHDGDIRKAIGFANKMASDVVQRFGTVTI